MENRFEVSRITDVPARQLSHVVHPANYVGVEAGALMRTGREARSEFNESYAVEKADDETLGSTALEALGRIGDPSAIEPLCRELVREDRFPQRDAFLTATGQCLASAGTEVPRLRDGSVIGALRKDPFRRYLRDCLASETPELKAAANRLIRAYGDDTLLPGLVEHLDDLSLAPETVAFLGALPVAAERATCPP